MTVRYSVGLANYAGTFVKAPTPIVIKVVDSCDAPFSITKVDMEDQVYTITQDKQYYQFDPFTVEPDFCDVEYSFKFVGDEAYEAVTLTKSIRTFGFYFASSTDLAGETGSKDYKIKVIGKTGKGEFEIKDSKTFTLTILNPCENEDYYKVIGKRDPDTASVEYILDTQVSTPIVDFFSFEV